MGGFSLFNTIVPPSSGNYRFGWCALRGGGTNSNASDGQYQNANSNHPGGANFLFADGSVRFIKSTVDMRTYWALGTRNRRRGRLGRPVLIAPETYRSTRPRAGNRPGPFCYRALFSNFSIKQRESSVSLQSQRRS